MSRMVRLISGFGPITSLTVSARTAPASAAKVDALGPVGQSALVTGNVVNTTSRVLVSSA